MALGLVVPGLVIGRENPDIGATSCDHQIVGWILFQIRTVL